ncbi:MAG: ATP-binding protein, partial [Solirubrobacterales bacterium]|nr:ATP-binding protein [Solirubrobacterales bacterium]
MTGAPPALMESWVDATLRAAVGRVAASDPDPVNPFRGLYISDASALDAAARLDGAELDDRVQRLAEAGGLSDELDVALLALCAAP